MPFDSTFKQFLSMFYFLTDAPSENEKVKQRTHRPKQVFPYGPNSNVAMVYGTVDYVFKDHSEKRVHWAARCDFVKLDQAYLDRYQVFLADDVAWNSNANS
ncbi:uncharacterized protein N7511_011080 [Penicillium nucicola]|uniref:uncharacterized protein n=1 Tax=Penicillium nucicola TaxID=1850975 RepID=UPI0025457A2B|nr:uncharacterized protein N7511_011080 [Penicillium nucicola]KAJ5749384.1 hypothetical protein N7511_011080 [Penicillium nucicola]